METREELERKLAEIKEKEDKELYDSFWPYFSSLKGKCFKQKNSYGGNSKSWNLYSKVVDITYDDMYLPNRDKIVFSTCRILQFHKTSCGEIIIKPVYEAYTHGLGEEIKETEFNRAFKKICDEINGLA